jgi:hypothetical protein
MPRVALDVEPGREPSEAGYAGGIVLTAVGGAAVLPGIVGTLGGWLIAVPFLCLYGGPGNYLGCVGTYEADVPKAVYSSPYIFVPSLIGAGLLAIGLPLVLRNHRRVPTVVTTSPAAPAPAQASRATFPSFGAHSLAELAIPKTTSVPILDLTF